MKQLRPVMPRLLALGMLSMGMLAFSQKQTKNYNENFKVGADAVLDISTSYADIQFETWDKNEVYVEASIELDGASEEEAEAYFKNSGIKILGNSKTIEIRTYGNNNWSVRTGLRPLNPADRVSPVAPLPDMEPLFLALHIPELPPMPEMPPMPPIPDFEFDYDAFQKDGEKYMKKWKKEFNRNFDKEFQENMEAWGKEYAERAEERRMEMEERRQAMEEQRTEMREQLRDQAQEAREQANQAREQAQQARQQALQEAREVKEKLRYEFRNSDAPNIFFHYGDGETKSYKVKKTIKIKMPKSATLKMNVRHGEVKLAANTKNMNATLSYASLQATTIEGDRTQLTASYSPVRVAQWKYGNLNTSFSEAIELDAVTELKLTSTSSEVVINKLLKNLWCTNDLGRLQINAVAPDFNKLDIRVQNGELDCVLPSTPFTINARNIRSDFTYPASWSLERENNGQQLIYTGYSQKGDTSKALSLTGSYSAIILK